MIVAVTGDADAVKNAVLTARDVGLQLLVSMGSYPESPGNTVSAVNFNSDKKTVR